MSDEKGKSKAQSKALRTGKRVPVEPEKTVIKSLGLGGTQGGGAPCAVDVKDGKIVRVRPLHYDWKYDRKAIQSLEDSEERQNSGTSL